MIETALQLAEPGISDSLQLWAAAAWRKPSLHGEWILGLAHDYRFGQSRVYPVAGMGWQFSRGATCRGVGELRSSTTIRASG